jgi:hypothetical protein
MLYPIELWAHTKESSKSNTLARAVKKVFFVRKKSGVTQIEVKIRKQGLRFFVALGSV